MKDPRDSKLSKGGVWRGRDGILSEKMTGDCMNVCPTYQILRIKERDGRVIHFQAKIKHHD